MKLDGATAVLVAARQGHLDCLRLLLDEGATINYQMPSNGTSALLLAAMHGRTSCLQLLIERGANINIRTTLGVTPLFIATQEGHEECVRILLDRGADAKITGTIPLGAISSIPLTPLMVAIGAHGFGHPITKLLEAHS
jgi:ankyrin repeat protein